MAVDLELVRRLEDALKGETPITKKSMFGGICFFHAGNMLAGVSGRGNKLSGEDGGGAFMFRVGKQLEAEALERKGAAPMILGENPGRRMGGLIEVEAAHCQGDALKGFLTLALDFARSLPAK